MSSTPPSPRRQFFEPLTGDESGQFELQLVRDALALLEERLAGTESNDDFVFQSHLRYLASLYYFLGATNLEDVLSRCMERKDVSAASIRRWLNGQTAPAPTVRIDALGAAATLLRNIELERRLGASLYDLTSSHK